MTTSPTEVDLSNTEKSSLEQDDSWSMRGITRSRDLLQRTAPDQTTVSDFAIHYGFWHLRQFAEDYRKLSGVLPSQTLGDQQPLEAG
jgi:AraC-like DNA-binding protein